MCSIELLITLVRFIGDLSIEMSMINLSSVVSFWSKGVRFFSYIHVNSPRFAKAENVVSKEIHIKADNLRYDKILATVFNVSRHKIDNLNLQDRVYLNGSELKKKGKKIKISDIIEVDFDSSERKYLFERKRVEVLHLKQDKLHFNVVFLRYNLYGYVLRDDNPG